MKCPTLYTLLDKPFVLVYIYSIEQFNRQVYIISKIQKNSRRGCNEETPETKGSCEWLRCARNIQRMCDEKLTNRAFKPEGSGTRRGTLTLRWRICVESGLGKTGVNNKKWQKSERVWDSSSRVQTFVMWPPPHNGLRIRTYSSEKM